MVYRLCLAFSLVCCSGCVTTTRTTMYCNKTIDLDNDPASGTMDVGLRFELFRDFTQRRK